MKISVALLLIFCLVGCIGIPEGMVPVKGFDLPRYLGTWYEIARLDHTFERGLINVTAQYSLNDDGSVRVVNRGYDPVGKRWKEAIGKARPAAAQDVGQLYVSFFGPFYASYNIIELDHADYSYALVTGPNRSYLWLLSRKPRLETAVQDRLLKKAKELGFETDKLIFVEQEALPGG
jgi:apolipoprotein D and lipocalin family protein